MSDLAAPFSAVLEGTGYLSGGKPAPNVDLGEEARRGPRRSSFHPDARWRSRGRDVHVYFKYASSADKADVTSWQQEIWNEGTAPLLWVVGPNRVDLYNGFGSPRKPEDLKRNHLKTWRHDQLGELDHYAGRLAMETGQFWRNESRVDRQDAVDRRLLDHLRTLQDRLCDGGLPVAEAQGLIGRSIFVKYLVDRGIVTESHLLRQYGYRCLEDVLRSREAVHALFEWLRDRFNGDMFPPSSATVPEPVHLERIANFLEGGDADGQGDLFPYRFDVIPVELISAIYEQFVHSRTASGALQTSAVGVHYTPPPVVSFVLDEVMQGFDGHESVLDLTCGSGIFLVEAFRRLVDIKAEREPRTTNMIRETLYNQIYGVDISEPAIQVAAFSLALAAMEMDPEPSDARSLRFKQLQGTTLLVGNAYDIELTPGRTKKEQTKAAKGKFDLIVGNPPWGKDTSHEGVDSAPAIDGPTSLRYLSRARSFAHDKTRFGMVLSATAFFPGRRSRLEVVQRLVEDLSPLTLVNLSNLSSWLFEKANMPAMVLMARYREQRADAIKTVQTEWSPVGAKGRVIDVIPSDASLLPTKSWRRHPGLLKATFYGRLHDQLLLDEPPTPLRPLGDRLNEMGVTFSEGLKRGSAHDAGHLRGLPLLAGLRPFNADLAGEFTEPRAERPRDRETYQAPLLLVQEFMRFAGGGGRAVSAVSGQDLVFTNAFNGASFPPAEADIAYLIAAILGSAFASWYFTMAASEFGVWKRRLLLADIRSMPVPDLRKTAGSGHGRHIVSLAKSFEGRELTEGDWGELDDAVLDLYALRNDDRLVVRDGLIRSSWQWDPGRRSSIAPAEEDHLTGYVGAFVGSIDPWFEAAGQRRLRAEIIRLKAPEPLRAIRFVLEDVPPPSVIGYVAPPASLAQLLAEMSKRYGVEAEQRLAQDGELRTGNDREVVFVKPAARRHWLPVNALSDARRVLEASFKRAFG